MERATGGVAAPFVGSATSAPDRQRWRRAGPLAPANTGNRIFVMCA